jgi:hypothetical protein
MHHLDSSHGRQSTDCSGYANLVCVASLQAPLLSPIAYSLRYLWAFAWSGDAKKLSSSDSFGKNVAEYSKLGQIERFLLHWVGLGTLWHHVKTFLQ